MEQLPNYKSKFNFENWAIFLIQLGWVHYSSCYEIAVANNKIWLFSEYYPQNIMHDRRVARGSTYAAMVIPAGTNPEAMMSKQTGTQDFKKKSSTFKKTGTVGNGHSN